MKTKALIILFLFILVVLFFVFSQVAQAQDLDEFKKQTIESIREITLQLVLITAGIFALFGGFVTTSNRVLRKRGLIWVSFISLAFSLLSGLFTYGNLIYTLGKGKFDPFGDLSFLATFQWVSFGIGGMLFGIFVLLNIKAQVARTE